MFALLFGCYEMTGLWGQISEFIYRNGSRLIAIQPVQRPETNRNISTLRIWFVATIS